MTVEADAEAGPCQCPPCLARAQTAHVRAGRWIVAHSDLTKPTATLIRWALLLLLGLCCWAAGIPLVVRDWLGPIIIAGALILPDVAGFGIAGMRLDLRQAQDELASLKLRVDMRQDQRQNVNVNFPAATAALATRAEVGEMALRQAAILRAGEEAPVDVPS